MSWHLSLWPVTWCWSADTVFWHVSIPHNKDVQYRVPGCYTYTLALDAEQTYSHMTIKIFRMDVR